MADELEVKPVRSALDDVSLLPSDSADTSSALDALNAELGEPGEPSGADDNTLPPEPAAAAVVPPVVAAAAAPAVAVAPVAPVVPSVDPLDAIELPPHTKPKSAEAFNLLKTTAKTAQEALRKEITDATAEKARLAAELETERAKAATPLTEEVKAELDDLRKFRLSKEVESDPAFRKIDTQITSNIEGIYKKLGTAGFSPESIAKIKELGGPDGVDWEPILAKLPTATRRYIESTLVDNERLKDNREEALTAAKANAEGYNRERVTRETNEVTGTANSFLKDLPWTAEQKIPAGATPEQIATITAANKFATESVARLQDYLKDRSPSRYAELAVIALIAHKNKGDLSAANDQLAGIAAKQAEVETAHKAALTTLTADRDKLKAELDKIKRAQRPRHSDDGITPPAPVNSGKILSGSEALDAAYAEVKAKA